MSLTGIRCRISPVRVERKIDTVPAIPPSREGCPFCAKAKALLAERGYRYAEINLPHTDRSRALGAIAGAKTVPQVFVNGERIGGWEDLEQWVAAK